MLCDREALLRKHEHALREAEEAEGVLMLWPPRLSEFPPRREPRVSAELSTLSPILAADLQPDLVHSGRLLRVVTISEPALQGQSVVVVAEDEAASPLRLVLHYFTAEKSLAGVRQQLPQGSHLAVKAPFVHQASPDSFAVVCSHPENLDFQPLAADGSLDLCERLLDEQLFGEVLVHAERLLEDAPGSERLLLCRAEALVGVGSYRDAARELLKMRTDNSGRRAGHVMQLIRENEKGEYDFRSLHATSAEGPTRFPCASYVSAAVAVRDAGPQRGQGVFALRPILPGELIFGAKAEHILFTRDISGRRLRRMPGYDEGGVDNTGSLLLAQALAKEVLRDARRRKPILSLSRGAYEASTGEDEAVLLRLLQIVEVNRFNAALPWDGDTLGVGLWATPARLNHACDASCAWYNAGDMWFARTQREIKEGEELSIAYCNPTDELAVRQEYLQKHYGFDCVCGLCQAQRDAPKGSTSDYDRHSGMLAALEARRKPDPKLLLKHHAGAFKALDAAAFCSQRLSQTEHAMAARDVCRQLGRKRDADDWLASAKEKFALLYGADPGVFELFKAHYCSASAA